MDTVIQENINPIEKVERSTLIVAQVIHNTTATELLKDDQIKRVKEFSSNLFLENGNEKDKLKIEGKKIKSSDKLKSVDKKPSKVGR